MVAPSGEQFELRLGDQVAVVVEVGGGVRSYSVGERPVLDGYDEADQCDGARGQTLAPWPNRVKDGKWSFGGQSLQLALTEPDQHNAIHGLVRWATWSVTTKSAAAVTLSTVVHPQPGYPWTVEVSNDWRLEDTGLSVTTTMTNRSDSAAPVAVGFHPYLAPGVPTVDDALLTLPAQTRLPTGPQQIPTGTEPVAGSAYDFREPRRIGDLRIDFAFTDLVRDADGRCRLRLCGPDGQPGVALWVDESYSYLEVFTGDTLAPGRRRRGLGIEPMSAPPNAMATGQSLVVLDPDGSWNGSWGIDPF